MIEVLVLNYLKDHLDVPVFAVMPDLSKVSGGFVVIEKTFQQRKNHTNEVNIAIQSYGDSLYKAIELDQKVQAIMDDFNYLDNIAGSRLTNDYNFTDTTTKKYRYQAIYKINYVEV